MLLVHVTFTELDEGEFLFAAGGKSENLYVVVDGEICLFLPGSKSGEAFYLHSRCRGETAGDFAVLNGGAHLVNAIAAKKSRVARFPRYAFELLTDIDPGILAHVYDVAAELSRRVMLARVYLDLLGDITTNTMNELLDRTEIHHYRNGQVVFEEGAEPDGLHIVISGRLNVETTDSNGDRLVIAEVHAPETVGELALLSESTRSACVYATRESTVAFLNKEHFNELIAQRPGMLLSLSKLIVRRHIENAKRSQPRSIDSNFVFIPLDSRLPVRRFLQQLKREMRTHGTSLLLDSRGFDTLYGKPGVSQTTFQDRFNSSIAEWLDDKENRHDQVIYLADADWSPWTKRCVNRADRILFLVNADNSNEFSMRKVELELKRIYAKARAQPKFDLVLLHPANTTSPSKTARWLKPRKLDAFHHIRIDDRQHMARLARRLTGKARGIVFSGGGARGYAHLGVQRVIEEYGIDIDYIGGSSMGGLLGASMAMGDSADDIYELSKTFANKRALFDYTLPVVSLMKSSKLTRFCREVYGNTRIEDLWIPYFCVSSNLADGKEVVHDQGELWPVIRSTISLPGVFSPVPSADGELLIDGAVLNTFPVDVMHRQLGGSGSIIGVNVSQLAEIQDCFDYGPSLSGWQVLLSRINPFAKRIHVPRIAETLLRSTDIKSILRLNETKALLDVLIEPDVSEIALLDFKEFARSSEIGYEAAKRVLAEHGLIEVAAAELDTSGTPVNAHNSSDVPAAAQNTGDVPAQQSAEQISDFAQTPLASRQPPTP